MSGWTVRVPRWVVPLAGIGALVAFVAAATFASYYLGVWHDEGFTYRTTRGSLMEAWRLAMAVELQPPLYFLALNAWRGLAPSSVGFVRVFSVVCAALAVLATARAASAAAGQPGFFRAPTALAVVLLLVANPFTMIYAYEARGYTLQILIGALLSCVVVDIQACAGARTKHVAWLAGLGVLATYVHYMALFVIVATGLALLVRRLLSIRQCLVLVACGIVAALPLVSALSSHFSEHASAPHEETSVLSAVGRVIDGFALLAAPALNKVAVLRILPILALLGWAGWLAFRGRRFSPLLSTLGVAIGFSALLYASLGAVAGDSATPERYFLACMPLSCLAVVLLVSQAFSPVVGWVLIGIVAAGGAIRSSRTIAYGHKPGDWRTAAELIRAKAPPGTPVFVFPPQESLALEVELSDPNLVQGFPRDYDGSALLTPRYFHVDATTLDSLRRSVSTRPFWFAYTDTPIVPWGESGSTAKVEQLISANTEVLARVETADSKLELRRLRAP